MRWFTADLHLGHRNIIDYCDRPYTTPEQMNDDIIDRANAATSPDDELYVLGDVALGKLDESLTWISQLHATVHMITGNHDRCFVRAGANDTKRAKALRSRQRYLDAGFATVADQGELTLEDGTSVNLSHFPYRGDHTDTDRYEHARLRDDGRWLICGHVHELWTQHGRQINVGVDRWDFTPVSETRLCELIAAGPTRH